MTLPVGAGHRSPVQRGRGLTRLPLRVPPSAAWRVRGTGAPDGASTAKAPGANFPRPVTRDHLTERQDPCSTSQFATARAAGARARRQRGHPGDHLPAARHDAHRRHVQPMPSCRQQGRQADRAGSRKERGLPGHLREQASSRLGHGPRAPGPPESRLAAPAAPTNVRSRTSVSVIGSSRCQCTGPGRGSRRMRAAVGASDDLGGAARTGYPAVEGALARYWAAYLMSRLGSTSRLTGWCRWSGGLVSLMLVPELDFEGRRVG
jgi:hypothetical protein